MVSHVGKWGFRGAELGSSEGLMLNASGLMLNASGLMLDAQSKIGGSLGISEKKSKIGQKNGNLGLCHSSGF